MNIRTPIILHFFIHLTSFVVAILVKFNCFTSPFVPNLKRPGQELITKESEYCCWSLLCTQYGPVTMIVPASGQQVRCIRWVQMGTFNKEIGFYVDQILCIEYILWGTPTIESTFDVANMVKTATVKDVPINNDALLNIQTC